MAEVKNSFIKSKMNKDLDARLIPSGEYRDAVNIQVSKSEGDDVGALENVLGNFEIADIESELGFTDLKCIGYFVDEFNSIIYMFMTNYTDENANGAQPVFSEYTEDLHHGIYTYNIKTENLSVLIDGYFLNFSTNKPIIGINLLEGLLFWTDDRNQPRKINVSKSYGYYTNEDQISVAKYYPYQAPEVIKETSTPGEYETTMYNVSEENLPDGTTPNPYRDDNFPGDPKYLEDKFVRFSYRFKFDDGEYSLIAPFTQPCFIPKQDGYFLEGDEKQTVASTIVEFMENKVQKIALQIPLPSDADDLERVFKVKEIDIIYKESDALALQVVETIPVSKVSESGGSSEVYEYVYLSQKPYKTLPSEEVARVYDKVPVRALGQEVISNRVVYANFQDKHTPPSSLNYKVNASEKYTTNKAGIAFPANARTEYPNHSLKENRNYQIGIVLSDKYGRQSTTILSNNTTAREEGFGADTTYLPYRDINDSISFAGSSIKILFEDFIQSQRNQLTGNPGLYSNTNPLGWYSYKVVIKQLEQDYYNVYTPGAIKGVPFYDNTDVPLTDENASFITLLNDNINKVPRDLSEVGPQDKQFRSSVELFGRVENTSRAFSITGNKQYFPRRKSFTTNTIEDLFDLFDVLQFEDTNNNILPITDTGNPYYAFYRSESNPFIAEFITSQTPEDQFGLVNLEYSNSQTYENFENLAILETKPTISRLDIYYETSTSGLISDLNTAIGEDTSGAFDTLGFIYNHTEADAPQTVIASDFQFIGVFGQILSPASVTLTSVIDNLGNERVSEFEVVAGDSGDDYYNLRTSSGSYFYYGSNANEAESYTFYFNVVTDVEATVTATGSLTNVNPSIDNDNSSTIEVYIGESSILSNITGKNGSNDNNPTSETYTQGLVFSIFSQTGAGTFALQQGASLNVINTDDLAEGFGEFTLRVVDAGGAITDKVFNVEFIPPETDSQFTNKSYALGDGEGHAIWFTNNTTSLSTNIPSWLPSGYRVGYQAPTALNTTLTNYVCPDGTPNSEFTNITTNGGLTQGYFYVIIEVRNTSGSSQIRNVECNFHIQYRATSNDNWTSAVDIDDRIVDNTMSGSWGYGNIFGEGEISGMYLDGTNEYKLDTQGSTQGGGQSEGIYIAHKAPNNLQGFKAGKVFAFKRRGEYRIIVGNIHSDYGFFRAIPTGAQCFASSQNINVGGTLKIDDFFYSDDDTINTSEGVYRYAFSSNTSCDSAFDSDPTFYFAKEPFAKYVTQLYTNSSFTTKATLTPGTKRFRRTLYSASFPDVISNPEHVKDGIYAANFNANGLRIGSAFPCTYNSDSE